MKKLLLSTSLALTLLTVKAQSPLKNNGFENWNTISWQDPKFYNSSNDEEFRRGKIASPNVIRVKSPDSNTGAYAVRLETVTSIDANDTVFAFFANGDPGQNKGGIPYAERPTSLSGFYKGNFMAGDTAIVLVVFKKNGSAISMDIKKIGASQANYTAFTMPINLPPVIIPDTVIVAAASSNALADDKGIPGTVVYFDSFVFTGITNQPTDLNGDFEMWDTKSIDVLSDWYVNGGDGGAIKSTDKHSGALALLLETQYNDHDAKAYGAVVSNAIWVGDGPNGHYFGKPYTLTKDTLCGWYKYIPNGTDSASAYVSLTKLGMPIAGNGQGLPPVGTYTYFEIPFQAGSAPDSIQITLSSSFNNTTLGNVGSQLYLDDVYLKSQFVHVTATISDVNCNGLADGSITATAMGGETPYSFLWSNGDNNATAYNLSAGTYTVTVSDNIGTSTTAAYTVSEPTTMFLQTSSSNAVCGNSDGSVDVLIAGGTGPYSYSWSNGATSVTVIGLSAGYYWVTVSDANGCVEAEVAQVLNSGAPSLTVTQIDLSCAGDNSGEVSVSATGGTAAYTFSWSSGSSSNSLFGLAAGNYYLTVTDAASCNSLTIVTITEPANLSVSATASDVSCFGITNGSVSATAMGGTGIYSYSWNTGSSNQIESSFAPGSYTVTVTDANGCINTTTTSVNEPSQLGVSFVPSDVNCFGGSDGSAYAIGSGGTGTLVYTWSNSTASQFNTNLVAGTYTVTISDVNSCTMTSTVSISEPTSALVVNASSTGNTASAVPTGGTGSYTYTWSSGGTTDTESSLADGTYTVTVTDANGCESAQTVVVLSSSVQSLTGNETAIALYPNPAKEQLNVAVKFGLSGTVLVKVINVLGEQVLSAEFKSNTGVISLNINELPAGVYSMELLDGNTRYIGKFTRMN